MNTINVTTPALLFPAISLLLLAYTNRFLTLAQIIRGFTNRPAEPSRKSSMERQLNNLSRRVSLIRWMQFMAVMSFLSCTVAMFCIFIGQPAIGTWCFGGSLLLLAASLVISAYEVAISTEALRIHLEETRRQYADAE